MDPPREISWEFKSPPSPYNVNFQKLFTHYVNYDIIIILSECRMSGWLRRLFAKQLARNGLQVRILCTALRYIVVEYVDTDDDGKICNFLWRQ